MNIKQGASILVKHIAKMEKCYIQVDSDCDGYTSSSLLINYLYRIFPTYVTKCLTYGFHEGKQHGIDLSKINSDIKLVIVPDAGSNDYEQHKILQQCGVDVIVIDHHKANKISEDACIINNQLCNYNNKNLPGVGMVYKFCCYLDELLNINCAQEFCDLVALGCISDMMDMRENETKALIIKGLKNINNPFFKAMIEKQDYSLKGQITPMGVAFYVAPFVNAVTRVGTKTEKIILFDSMLEFKAFNKVQSTKRGDNKDVRERIVDQSCRNCINIKRRQDKERDIASEKILDLVYNSSLKNDKIIIICLNSQESINKNLVGLIANKIANKLKKPTLILNDNGNFWEGSGRNFSESPIKNLRSFLEKYNNQVIYAQGHEGAFGIGINKGEERVLKDKCNEELKNVDFSPIVLIDKVYDFNSLTNIDILSIADHDELWGQGIEIPKFVINNIKINSKNCQLLKGNTLKISPVNSDITFIKFKLSEEEQTTLFDFKNDWETKTLNIIGTFKKNIWNGVTTPQIEILDFEISNTDGYYF